MVKGSEVMQIVFSMKIRVEIMAIQSRYCMLELVFFKVLSHTDTVHVAEDASESAFITYLRLPGASTCTCTCRTCTTVWNLMRTGGLFQFYAIRMQFASNYAFIRFW